MMSKEEETLTLKRDLPPTVSLWGFRLVLIIRLSLLRLKSISASRKPVRLSSCNIRFYQARWKNAEI